MEHGFSNRQHGRGVLNSTYANVLSANCSNDPAERTDDGVQLDVVHTVCRFLASDMRRKD
eukprot:296076-Pleurochrysis_carterae.AAC.1